jgi:outer membrane protein TolC
MIHLQRITAILLLFFSFNITLKAQETLVMKLDLETSIKIAKNQSYTMLMLKEGLNAAQYQLKAANSSFKTHINMDITAPNYSESIVDFQDSEGMTYFSNKQLSYSGSLTIDQPLPTDGRLFVRSGIYNTDDYDQDEKFMKLQTRIGLTQPIQSLYAYNSIKSEYEKARLNYDLTSKRLKRNELDLIYRVSKAFYDLNASKEHMSITKMSMDRLSIAYEIAQNKYKAGLIREVEALQMEVDLGEAQNAYDLATVNNSTQLNVFKQVLGLPLSENIELKSNFDYDPIEIDIKIALKKALENRLELKEQQLQIDLTNIELKRIKSKGTISGDLEAYYDFVGMDKYDINKSLGGAINGTWGTLKDRPANFGVLLKLKIPILDWGENRSRVKAVKAQIKQSVYQQEAQTVEIESQVIRTVNEVHSTLRRLELLKKNKVIAEKSFAISQNRFSNGDIDSQTLALDRERLDKTNESHLRAFIDYKLKLADLMRKTFYDFEKNQDVIY